MTHMRVKNIQTNCDTSFSAIKSTLWNIIVKTLFLIIYTCTTSMLYTNLNWGQLHPHVLA